MAKQIVYGDASQQGILRGVNSLANAVKVTLGPKGRNVIIGGRFGSPTITKDVVLRAIEEPMRWIATNAGHEGSMVVQRVQAGVIDPTKVVRSALQNAASIASLLLTTEAVISQIPEEHKNAAAPGGDMGGMY